MTKIAFINPGNNSVYGTTEPINLALLAGFVRVNLENIEVIIADELAGEDVYTKVETFNPDYIAITGVTPLILRSYEIADYFRNKGYIIIIGGVHASILPNEALEHADYVVVGEGEKSICRILSGEAQEGIVEGEWLHDINEIPLPAWDLLNMDYYLSSRDRLTSSFLNFIPVHKKVASVLSSRGCPYDCCFCHNSYKGLPYRFNSPDKVLKEIKELVSTYNVEAIFFIEDNFFSNKRRAMEICKLLQLHYPNLIWGANARVDGVTPELLAEAKKSGCRQITFGFESGSDRILKLINKKATVEQNSAAVDLCNSIGLGVNGTFIIGNPTETSLDLELTKEFIINSDISNGIGVCIATPFPGTKLWDWCEKKGLIPTDFSWNDFNYRELVINPSNVDDKTLLKYYNDIQNIVSIKWNGPILVKNILSVNFLRNFPSVLLHPMKAIKKIKRIKW